MAPASAVLLSALIREIMPLLKKVIGQFNYSVNAFDNCRCNEDSTGEKREKISNLQQNIDVFR